MYRASKDDLPPPETLGVDLSKWTWPAGMCRCINIIRTPFISRLFMVNLDIPFGTNDKFGVIREVLTILPGPVFNRTYFNNVVNEYTERKKKPRTES